jgi:PTS system nitrogen regulatory IIA component
MPFGVFRGPAVAEDDFDISSLAAYLHMMPEQINKLAERAKIPARRVGGEWRFSRPEIHHWLEDRIGLSDDAELALMETNLERTDRSETGDITLAELISPEAIAVPLAARTRGSVVSAMCELAAETGLLWDPAKMADAVSTREQMHPTALDIGVALLHPRRPQSSILSQALVALGITGQGIPFGGASGLTDVFFLICSTSDHEHLRILARVSRLINDPDWLARLRGTSDARDALELIVARDQDLG